MLIFVSYILVNPQRFLLIYSILIYELKKKKKKKKKLLTKML